mgnify:CR=1 FL=1
MIIHFLDDIGPNFGPITCTQWGDEGELGIPPIVDDGPPPYTISNWFENPNGAGIGVASLIVFIDHTMKIFNIMGSSPSFTMANIIIETMLEALPIPIYGCLVPGACNYNPDATEDDGSCEFIADGKCTVINHRYKRTSSSAETI